MTDRVSERAEGFYWTRYGTNPNWDALYWRGGYFWDASDNGYSEQSMGEIGPQIFPPGQERRASPAVEGGGKAEPPSPDYWAVWSSTGTHIGTWPDKADAWAALAEYEGRIPRMKGTIKALSSIEISQAEPVAPMPSDAELLALDRKCKKLPGGLGMHYRNYAHEVLKHFGRHDLHPSSVGVTASEAARDVLAERRHQVEGEGWTPEHDDAHDRGEMGKAAGVYALAACSHDYRWVLRGSPVNDYLAAAFKMWPWDWSWFKPTDRRRDLVKAGALIIAEIERLDRAAALKENG